MPPNKRRRKTDNFTDETDHDLLIKHSVKIDNICVLVTGVDEKLDKFNERIDTRCDHRTEVVHEKIGEATGDLVDQVTFRWIIGIMILAMISMVAIIGVNQVANSRSELEIQANDKELKELKEDTEKLDKRIKFLHKVTPNFG